MSNAVCEIGVVSFPPVLSENPYQRKLYAAMADHGFRIRDGDFKINWMLRNRARARLLHFHWPVVYYSQPSIPHGLVSWLKLVLFAFRLIVARALGYRVAWTIHEVYPLEGTGRRLDFCGIWLLARFSHVLLANDDNTAQQAKRELGRAADSVVVVPHSSYVDTYPEGRTREEVRTELGIPADAFGFLLFGHLSVYKNIGWFVDSFRAAAPEHAVLIVAGLVMHEEAGEAVRAAAAEDARVKPLLEFIPDERVRELYAAADAAICPRQDGGTSGALMLAFSMSVAGVVAKLPNYEAVTAGEKAAWLFRPNDRESLESALRAAASDPDAARAKGAAGRRLVEPLSWEKTGERTAELLRASFHHRGVSRDPVVAARAIARR
jgi:beta-1,4-mannosyltransferase